MQEASITGKYEVLESGRIEIFLRISDEMLLRELCSVIREVAGSDEPRILPRTQVEGPDGSFSDILVRRIKSGRPEGVCLDQDAHGGSRIVWEGDDEYWLEVAEKCDRLIESGYGHQYLIVRSSNSDIALSYRESHWTDPSKIV